MAEPPASDHLAASWRPRTTLQENGISSFATWTIEVWGNVAGGLQKRGWWNSLLDFGVEIETGKLGLWSGGSFLVQGHWAQALRDDVFFADFTGAFNPASSAMARDHVRAYNVHYRHAWREEALVLKIGQMAADDDFMLSDYSGLFFNSAFGPLLSQVGTPLAACCDFSPAFPIFPVAAPGVLFHVRPFEGFYTQLGLYDGRPGLDEPGNYGFDWAGESWSDLGVLWESGYHYTLRRRKGTMKVGLSYHTGALQDFLNATVNERTTQQTVPNFYIIHDLQLLADGEENPRLGVFARGGITPEPRRSVVGMYADTGLNWFAPLPGRKADAVGIGVSHTRFGSDFRQSTSGAVASSETTVELTYKAQVTRWMVLQADAQWLFNPAVNPASGSRETATVFGLRAQIDF